MSKKQLAVGQPPVQKAGVEEEEAEKYGCTAWLDDHTSVPDVRDAYKAGYSSASLSVEELRGILLDAKNLLQRPVYYTAQRDDLIRRIDAALSAKGASDEPQ
jgi:hypothetical protein